MKSMKKLILLACLAGTVNSMNAGIWQNIKESCGGLYAACAKSISSNTSALSTKACKTYASCIDTLRTNKDAAVVTLNDVGTSIATGANTAGQAVVKVTAPVVSTAKTGANGITSAAYFTYENPKLVVPIALASIAAYLAHCRSATAHWLADIKEAQAAVNAIAPDNNFKDWRVKAAMGKPALNIADLMNNSKGTYAALKIERGNGESDNAFIARMLGSKTKKGELQEEQDLLLAQADKIKSACLAHAHILPSLRSHEYKKQNNFVNTLIQNRIDAMPESERYIDLSAEQMQFINQQINNKVAASYINPLKMARRWALPNEAAAIKLYWDLYQSIQRIEALKDCVQKEREHLNLQRDPRAARQLAIRVNEPVDNLQ